MATNETRAKTWLKQNGCLHYGRTEYTNSFTGLRKDLFGIIDGIAIMPDSIMAVQVCGKDWQPHIRKIEKSKAGLAWVQSGNPFLLIGWRKLKGKGWQPRIKYWKPEDFKTGLNVDSVAVEDGLSFEEIG